MLRLLLMTLLVPSAFACGGLVGPPESEANLAWALPLGGETAAYMKEQRCLVGWWKASKKTAMWRGRVKGRWNDGTLHDDKTLLDIRKLIGFAPKTLGEVVVLTPIEGSEQYRLVAYTARVKGFDGKWFHKSIGALFGECCCGAMPHWVYPHKGTVKVLSGMLATAKGEQLERTCESLGKLGRTSTEARSVLIDLLSRPEVATRHHALRGLGLSLPANYKALRVALSRVAHKDEDAGNRKYAKRLYRAITRKHAQQQLKKNRALQRQKK